MPRTPVEVPAPKYHPDVGEYEAAYEMTAEEFLDWDHGGFAEWVDGRAYKYTMVTPPHQLVVQFMVTLLETLAEFRAGGVVLSGPAAMRCVPGGRIREPDIVYVLPGNASRITDRLLEGPADLVIEVVSPDSPARDRVTKLEEYDQAGIPEYWVVDPRPGSERVEFFARSDGGRLERRVADENGVYHSAIVSGLWVRVSWLLDGGASLREALREVVRIGPLPPAPGAP
ncbi:MAG: Uma2 family endonuclease [Dehalococcoidia bacterium]|nr:Uma2 family endonuclease [Dehalococcoidia bacterium]